MSTAEVTINDLCSDGRADIYHGHCFLSKGASLMNRWLTSIRLLFRRLLVDRSARQVELENIELRARLNWMRKAIEVQRAHVLDRVPRQFIAADLHRLKTEWRIAKETGWTISYIRSLPLHERNEIVRQINEDDAERARLLR
ncbi:MAG TPA: hypothetical protein VF543_22605, partial [Pyrinomonadaceae bacterium]